MGEASRGDSALGRTPKDAHPAAVTRGSKLFPKPRITGGGFAGPEAKQHSPSFPRICRINVWMGHAAGNSRPAAPPERDPSRISPGECRDELCSPRRRLIPVIGGENITPAISNYPINPNTTMAAINRIPPWR